MPMMTESEIIQFMKNNKTKFQVFAALPDEVKKWCEDVKGTKAGRNIICWRGKDEWTKARVGEKSEYLDKNVYALDDKFVDYENIQGVWEEFPILKDGKFYLLKPAEAKASALDVQGFYWWDWVSARTYIAEHNLPYTEFGGWKYDGTWATRPAVRIKCDGDHFGNRFVECYVDNTKNSARPCTPKSIRFWKRGN